MDNFNDYLELIENPMHRQRLQEIFTWIKTAYPQLEPRFAWNQPMFTDHGTFIISFSASKKHLSISPEIAGIIRFSQDILEAGYTHKKMMFQIPWDMDVNYELLQTMIDFNIEDKKDCQTFWRKP